MNPMPDKSMEEVILEDGRYPPQAFALLNEGLQRAVQRVHGEEATPEGPRHVSGKELCEGIRDVAVERWGLLAGAVLRRWNVRSTLDFGHMVYLLIEHDFMKKTPEDSLEDFYNVYDFAETFDAYDRFELGE